MIYLRTYESINPIISHYPNGKKELVAYLNKDNELHNENGSARQEWYKNGQKKLEQYYINGKLHREDGPAIIWWFEDGKKHSESYYINDKYHREDGPAYQKWYDNGQKQSEYYYINNEEYNKKNWIKKLKEINSPHYDEQKIKYESELYNL